MASKRNSILISLLLIGAAIIIQALLKDIQTTMDTDLISFFAGILFGGGIATILSLFVKKKSI